MSFEFIRKLPTPDEIRKEYPMPEKLVRLKEERDQETCDVITERAINSLLLSGPAPQIMRTPYVIISPGLPGLMKLSRTS